MFIFAYILLTIRKRYKKHLHYNQRKSMNRLVLWTVQLGLKYGINNKFGKPTLEESFNILDTALKNGISTFDTAMAYWDAEEILWKFISTRNLKGEVKIISKLKPNIFEEKDLDVNEILQQEITWSLKRLNIDFLDWYLFHTPKYIYRDDIVNGLKYYKNQWLIKNRWVSIYEPEDALYAVKNTDLDYIQIPYNVFDQRLDKTDFFSIAKDKWIRVFARTAFIQWLILMQDKDIPENLSEVKWYLYDLDTIINKYGLSRLEASLLFVNNHQYIDNPVIWVDTMQQLTEDIEITDKPIDFEQCHQELKSKFSDVNKIIFFPSLWSKIN